MSGLYAPAADVWQRILSKTDTGDGCWTFTGAVNSRGYGSVGAGRKGKTVLAHRVAVLVRDGEIPEGMTVDHLCRNKRCVRPDHLEVVTVAENNRRGRAAAGYEIGGRCGSGHALTEDTVYRHPRGQLVCRQCQRTYSDKSPLRMVRDWALDNGYVVAARGRLSPKVITAYMAAHQERAA